MKLSGVTSLVGIYKHSKSPSGRPLGFPDLPYGLEKGFRNLANPVNNQQLYVHYDLQTTG
jgi:hypothetical protein